MAVIAYEDIGQVLIENTIMQKCFIDDIHKVYTIRPIDGYVLHDNAGDIVIQDQATGDETSILAYFTGSCSCSADYDFVVNPREFYAVAASCVPKDQIFGCVFS